MLGPSKFHTPTAPTQRWETASFALKSAVESYLNSCLYLESSYLHNAENPTDLAFRIDSSLDSLSTTLSKQLSQSHSSLARTRNKIASPLCDFPEELLAEIFLDIVYMPTKIQTRALGDTIRAMYRSLYALIGVCSVWKKAAATCRALWTVVPLLDPLARSSLNTVIHPATDLSLQRAGSQIHLVADLSQDYDPEFDALANYIQRFNSVHIRSESNKTITRLIRTILESRSLVELSVCKRPRSDEHPRDVSVPESPQLSSYQYITPDDLARQPEFRILMESIPMLRLSSVLLPWDSIKFTTRLQELHIRGIEFHSGMDMLSFLCALSSASEIRDLRVISVSTRQERTTPPPSHLLSLPKLL
ncbi:hypothetical protein RSAG8_08196, partial [Rhizoctonia solani AG-8 WAC10335]